VYTHLSQPTICKKQIVSILLVARLNQSTNQLFIVKKIAIQYKLKSKRNPNLITPCCGKQNRSSKGGCKFANYIGLPECFGYCFSCGKSTRPPTIYVDEKGGKFTWNTVLNKFEAISGLVLPKVIIGQSVQNEKITPNQKFIDERLIWKFYRNTNENNLLKYIRITYQKYTVDDVFLEYALGTSKNGGMMFWERNKKLQVQSVKINFFQQNGRRTNKFNRPYLTDDGYLSCLFGEHLINDDAKGKQKLILVESEKTAIIGAILMGKFTWLSYGGASGFSRAKNNCLIGHTVLVIPDMENKAVEIINNKIIELRKIGVNASVWDMTNGRTDEQLELDGDYKCDLEDVFRRLIFENKI